MKAFQYLLATFAFAPCITAQGQFGLDENSADVLAALKEVDHATVLSGEAASRFKPDNATAKADLIYANIILRANWQTVIFTASARNGFYKPSGAQEIIKYINEKLYPHTKDADVIYIKKREDFVKSGFIKFVNPGLLQLRMAVDSASASVQARTTARLLQAMTVAFTQIEVDYAETQETQQFGPDEEGFLMNNVEL